MEFVPKALPYEERLLKVQRIMKAAIHRPDPKVAVRELCEAVSELTTALLEREQAQKGTQPAEPKTG